MSDRNEIQIFESRRVRTHWEAKVEKRYFAIVDIIAILTDSKNPGAYWRKLKQRLKKEGNETVTNCHTLKMIFMRLSVRGEKLHHQGLLELVWTHVPNR